MDWWQAALFGAGGGLLGVWVTWVAPIQQGPFSHVPRSLREPLWWVSSLGWIVWGAFWSVVMNHDKPISAFVAVQCGIVAPYAVQKVVQLAANAAESQGSIDSGEDSSS